MVIFEDYHDFIKELNFVIEPFGNQQISVQEIPVTFQNASVKELVLSILSQIKDYPNSHRDLTLDQKEKLQRQACRAAIKAGQQLYPEEVKQLLLDFIKSPNNYTCPHGRPLFIFYEKRHFESMFLRK